MPLSLCTVNYCIEIPSPWKQEWKAFEPIEVRRHVSEPGEGAKSEDLCREHWTVQNGLRNGVGRYRSSMKKWGLTYSAACECV